MRRLATLMGLALSGLGIWLMVAEQSRNALCNAQDVTVGGYGASPSCISIVGPYFGAFVLLVAGLVTLLVTLLMMWKRPRIARYRPSSGSRRFDGLNAHRVRSVGMARTAPIEVLDASASS